MRVFNSLWLFYTTLQESRIDENKKVFRDTSQAMCELAAFRLVVRTGG
jgi:hypothetical protein